MWSRRDPMRKIKPSWRRARHRRAVQDEVGGHHRTRCRRQRTRGPVKHFAEQLFSHRGRQGRVFLLWREERQLSFRRHPIIRVGIWAASFTCRRARRFGRRCGSILLNTSDLRCAKHHLVFLAHDFGTGIHLNRKEWSPKQQETLQGGCGSWRVSVAAIGWQRLLSHISLRDRALSGCTV